MRKAYSGGKKDLEYMGSESEDVVSDSDAGAPNLAIGEDVYSSDFFESYRTINTDENQPLSARAVTSSRYNKFSNTPHSF